MGRSRYLAAVLVAISLGYVAFPGAVRAQDVARDYYSAGADREATAALRNLDRFHYRPAVQKLQDRRYQAALPDLEFMLKYFPNHPQALAKTAELALASNRPDIAERRLKEALARYPTHDETYVIYGTFLQKSGRLDAAIVEYQKALKLNSESVYAHYNLGLAYVDRKDYSQANRHAQKAYQLGAGFPGLKRQLEAVGAWKPMEAASGDAAASAPATASESPASRQ